MAAVTVLHTGQFFHAKWTLTTADPTGDAVAIPLHSDVSVSFIGTWGGATANIDGHLEPVDADGTYLSLSDPLGSVIAATANSIHSVHQSTYFMRPDLSVVGAGASITVVLKANRKGT